MYFFVIIAAYSLLYASHDDGEDRVRRIPNWSWPYCAPGPAKAESGWCDHSGLQLSRHCCTADCSFDRKKRSAQLERLPKAQVILVCRRCKCFGRNARNPSDSDSPLLLFRHLIALLMQSAIAVKCHSCDTMTMAGLIDLRISRWSLMVRGEKFQVSASTALTRPGWRRLRTNYVV